VTPGVAPARASVVVTWTGSFGSAMDVKHTTSVLGP
jgi:hypothetical protein